MTIKELQLRYNKIIIFIDHEKVKEEDALVANSQTIVKYYPECMNGISKILTKELRQHSTMNNRKKKRKQFIRRRGWVFVNRRFNNED